MENNKNKDVYLNQKILKACFEFSIIIGSWNSYDHYDPCNHWKKRFSDHTNKVETTLQWS